MVVLAGVAISYERGICLRMWFLTGEAPLYAGCGDGENGAFFPPLPVGTAPHLSVRDQSHHPVGPYSSPMARVLWWS